MDVISQDPICVKSWSLSQHNNAIDQSVAREKQHINESMHIYSNVLAVDLHSFYIHLWQHKQTQTENKNHDSTKILHTHHLYAIIIQQNDFTQLF